MELSRTLVVLPQAPSAATSHVVAALAVALRAAPALAPFLAVRSWDDFYEDRILLLEQIRQENWDQTPSHFQSKPSSYSLDSLFQKVRDSGVENIVVIGGKKEAFDAFALHEWSLENAVSLNIQFIPDDETNSLGGTDHCLGYGSFSESFAHWIIGEDFDNYSFFNGVKILLAPGQETGWVALASAMSGKLGAARSIPHIGPHVVCLPEQLFSPEGFVSSVAKALKEAGRATVVVSQGVAAQVLPASHCEGDAVVVALQLSEYLTSLLRDSRERFPELEDVKVRSENGWASRHVLRGKVSDADRTESYLVAMETVQRLLRKDCCGMVGLHRVLGAEGYQCETVVVSLETALYRPHKVPAKFLISEKCHDSLVAFFSYLKPLWACSSNWREDSKAWGKSRSWQRPAWVQPQPKTSESVQA